MAVTAVEVLFAWFWLLRSGAHFCRLSKQAYLQEITSFLPHCDSIMSVTDENAVIFISLQFILQTHLRDPKSSRHCHRVTLCPWNAHFAFELRLGDWWEKHMLLDPLAAPVAAKVWSSFEKTFPFSVLHWHSWCHIHLEKGTFPRFVCSILFLQQRRHAGNSLLLLNI